MDHITGQSFTFMLDALQVVVENITLNITDESDVKYSGGRANGILRGKSSAEGEIELDAENMTLLTAYAATKGSWQELDGIDIRGIAVVRGNAQTVEAFGCMLQLKDLLNANPNGNEASTCKIGYKVAGKDFVKFNGVDYLAD
ncbi:MAG: phage protein [Cycloclasticus sp.]|jgi:Protein of unknown function (DUF2597).